MKAVTALLAAAMAGVLGVAGCMSTATTDNEGRSSGADQNTAGRAAPSSATAKPIKFGDTVKISTDDGAVFRVTVTRPKEAKPGPLGPPSGDKKIFAVTVTVVALKGNVDFNPLYFKAKSAQGDNFESGLGDVDNELDSGTLSAPDKERGLVAFEVPTGQTISSVSITGALFDTQATWRR